MDISRLKKLFAGVSAVAISLTQVGSVFAAYSDVPSGVWFADGVKAFTDAGYLDGTQTRFRGSDNANRAEFTKLVVELNGGILSTPPAVASFDDVKAGAWYYGYMEEAGKEGWVKGDNNCYGTHPCYARPSANINRAEAAAEIVRAFGLDATGSATSFVDVPAGQWYTSAVQTAADHCVLQGDDSTGRARPSDFMNRAEMVVMLHRVDQNLTFGVDCGVTPSAKAAIKTVTSTSTSTVEVDFNTNLDKTAMVVASSYMVSGDAKIAVNSVKMVDASTVELTLASSTSANGKYTLSVQDMKAADGKTFSDTQDFTGYSPIVQGNGTLEVSLASTNPVGDTVPRGANGVVVASYDLTASCDDAVTVTDFTTLHEGFGDSVDIDGVYATVDGARVSRRRTIDSQNQTSDVRFIKPLVIDACKTKTVDVVADFSSTATVSAEHNLSVELATDMVTNAKSVKGNFPLRGNTFKVGAVTSGQVTVSYRSVTPSTVSVGDTAVTLGRFQVAANSVEDQTIYSVTLEQNGSAKDGDLTNLKVRRSDGTVVTNTVAATVGDHATFIFDPPLTVLQGDQLTLEVVGDVVGGAANTAQFHFEENSDLFAVGSLYGYGVNGQLYGSQISIPNTTGLTTVTIKAGEFTVEIDGPVQQKFTKTQNNANLANVIMTTAGDAIDVRNLYVLVQGQTATGAGLATGNLADSNINDIMNNVQLRNAKTGQSISGVRLTKSGTDFATGVSSTSTYQIYRFDDFTVQGQDTWNLNVDFVDNGAGAHPLSGDQFRVNVCTSPDSGTVSGTALTSCFNGIINGATGTTSYNMKVKGLTTGDDVTDVRPGGTVTGNFHRIATPSLNIAVQSIGTADTAVKNSKNVPLFRFQARAGDAEDVLFTGSIFRSESGSLLNGQNYALWVDTDGDGVVDTILQKGVAAQSSAVSFNNLAGGGYVIPAESTVVFEVHSDIAANLTNNGLLLAFDTGSNIGSYVEAEQVKNGSNLSGIKTLNSLGTVAAANQCTTACDINVTINKSKYWKLVSQGDLFVTRDQQPRSRQLLGGALGDETLRLQFRAQNEDIDVTNLQFNSSGSTANSVDRLELYKLGATTPFATATAGGCGADDVLTTNNGNAGASIATFCASMQNQQLVVKDGVNTIVTVRPRMKSDDQGATSAQTVQFWLTKQAVANNVTGSGAVRARGLQSSNNLVANNSNGSSDGEVFIGTDTPTTSNTDIVGPVNQVVLAKITSIANANPDVDNTNVPTGVSPFGQFTFTAATNTNSLNGLNKATLSGVVFNVNATNVNLAAAAGSFRFYNKADSSNKVNCSTYTVAGASITGTASGSFLVECKGLKGSVVDTRIPSGSSTTFILEGNVTNSKTGTSTSGLQASIQNFTTLSSNSFGVSANATSHIDWLDEDTISTSFKWIEYGDTSVKSTSYKS